MKSDAQKPAFTNDAFISYSRKDIEFARRLEKALEAGKNPFDDVTLEVLRKGLIKENYKNL